MVLTPDLLRRCMPKASLANCTLAAPHLTNAMAHYGIVEPRDVAMFLAQVAHESGNLIYTQEIASGDAYDTRTDLGNTPEIDGDGRKWKGHGYLQVTGKTNHSIAAKEFGKPVDEIAKWLSIPEGASWSAAWFWKTHGLSSISSKPDLWRGSTKKFKGLDPFTYISVIINGGLTGIDDRRSKYETCKKALELK